MRAVGVGVVRHQAGLHAVRREEALRRLHLVHGLGLSLRLPALPVGPVRFETEKHLDIYVWKKKAIKNSSADRDDVSNVFKSERHLKKKEKIIFSVVSCEKINDYGSFVSKTVDFNKIKYS